MMNDLENKRLYDKAFKILAEMNRLLDAVIARCEKTESKKAA